MRRLLLRTLVAACAAVPLASLAQPAQPIRLVVGFAAGGGVDALARAVAQEMGRVLGRNVIVENRGGAGGSLAAEYVASAPADGTTLLFADTTLLTSPHVLRKVGYDPQKSFAPVGGVAQPPLVLAAHASVPARTPKELIELVKAAPGKYAYATAGVATMHHFSGELIGQTAGIDLLHVAYRGGAPAVQDLVGGQVQLAITGLPAVAPHAKAKRVKIIATLSSRRLSALPDVPALAELLPGFDATPSTFILAPAGTPAGTLKELGTAVRTAVTSKASAEAIESQGATPAPMSGAELAAWMQREEARWAAVAKKSGITLD